AYERHWSPGAIARSEGAYIRARPGAVKRGRGTVAMSGKGSCLPPPARSGARFGVEPGLAGALDRAAQCLGEIDSLLRRQEGADDERAAVARQRQLSALLLRLGDRDSEPGRLEGPGRLRAPVVAALHRQCRRRQAHLLVDAAAAIAQP